MHYKNKTAEIFKQRLYEEMALKNITAHKLAQKAKISENDIAYTLTTRTNNRVTDNFIKIDTEIKMENGRMNIRKLTPKECWRLMDINDTYFEKARQVNSNTQLYKQAGNGIVIAVLEAIFRQMID